MKHYIDIERARFEDEGLTKTNLGRFEVGDHVIIQEKVDGANSSITYEDGKLKAFSRKKELDETNTNRGFWNWVHSLNASDFTDLADKVCFGEHLVKHTIAYDPSAYNKFYVFDLWDKTNKKWLPQSEVKAFAEKHGFIYVNTFYDGKFISWEHCMSFLHSPAYGSEQEGVIVKNMDKLEYADDERNPAYIKIVNAQFKETQLKNHVKKVLDPNGEIERVEAAEHANELVTEARVRKEICKMIDEGLLPELLTGEDMAVIARNLPKRIYYDIDKEDHDTLIAYDNQYLGKAIGNVVMNYAKKIVLG